MNNKIISSGGFVPSSTDTPLDLRTRVKSVDDIYNIDLPYIGMIVYVIDEDKYYKIKTLKAKEMGVASVENAAVDTFEEFLIKGPQGEVGPQGIQGEQGPAGQDADISNLMTKENPNGTGALSLNRKADTEIGEYSSTLGYNCIASKDYCHAEGNSSQALNYYCHAEGNHTIAGGKPEGSEHDNAYAAHSEGWGSKAFGQASHAEGSATQANEACAHAEGSHSIANGYGSHAEGSMTQSNGGDSHAEGGHSIANGNYSHAEGWGTLATADAQHVQGKFNIEDTEKRYAHIVGNGTDGYNSAREEENLSNCHTLDWQGNAWFQGDVFIKGTSQDDGQKLATEDMVITLQQEIAELRAIIEELKNNSSNENPDLNDPEIPELNVSEIVIVDDFLKYIIANSSVSNEMVALQNATKDISVTGLVIDPSVYKSGNKIYLGFTIRDDINNTYNLNGETTRKIAGIRDDIIFNIKVASLDIDISVNIPGEIGIGTTAISFDYENNETGKILKTIYDQGANFKEAICNITMNFYARYAPPISSTTYRYIEVRHSTHLNID